MTPECLNQLSPNERILYASAIAYTYQQKWDALCEVAWRYHSDEVRSRSFFDGYKKGPLATDISQIQITYEYNFLLCYEWPHMTKDPGHGQLTVIVNDDNYFETPYWWSLADWNTYPRELVIAILTAPGQYMSPGDHELVRTINDWHHPY